ncbi:MAG: DUF1761 domain-containing protein [Proteobacteria bacterium]|nr:DUF1761 domain-containing protein [Pseudomonadota bacterium]
MAVAAINYWSIPLAALAAFLWGAAYYTTLSKQWLAAVGRTEPNRSPAPFAISLVALVVMAFVLSGAIAHLGPGQATVKNGIISGLILWAGFVVTTIFVNNAYPGRRYMLSIIDSIHWLGVLVIQGAIIGAL